MVVRLVDSCWRCPAGQPGKLTIASDNGSSSVRGSGVANRPDGKVPDR